MNNTITLLFYYSYLDAAQQTETSYARVTGQFIYMHYNIAQTAELRIVHTPLPSFSNQEYHMKPTYHPVFYRHIVAMILAYYLVTAQSAPTQIDFPFMQEQRLDLFWTDYKYNNLDRLAISVS
jgi:hypothetical protein